MDAISSSPGPVARPGKSAAAPGQLAKAAVAEARAAGAELPRNAQGVAASAIARGAEPGSVFAALVAPVTPPETPVTDTGTGASGETTPPDMSPDVPVGEAVLPASDETAATGDAVMSDPVEDALLILLQDGDGSTAA